MKRKRTAQSLRVTLLASVISLVLGAHVQAESEIKPKTKETPPISISVTSDHNIAYKSDGTVWYWEPTGDRPAIMEGMGDIASITAAPNRLNLILRKDGTVWNWGKQFTHTDGSNGIYEFRAPEQIKGLSDIVKVTVLNSVDAAIDKDGSVWVWVTQPDRTDPIKLKDITKAKDIAIAGGDVLILKEDGTVWKWTAYTNAGAPISSSTTMKIDNLSDIVAFSHGYSLHHFAIKKDGTVWGWGDNGDGALGLDLSIHNSYYPVRIESLSDVESITTGSYKTAVVKKDGTVWVIGLMVGDDPRTYSATPTQVEGLENVSSVGLGQSHALAVTKDGKLWTWGKVSYWDSNYTAKPIPVILPQKAGSPAPPSIFSSQNIGIKINERYIDINPKAILVNENTFIPLRGVIEAIGGKVTWLNEAQSITIEKGNTKVNLKIGSKEAFVNGNAILLDTAPFLSDVGSTYVPLRFVSDTIGVRVGWDAANWTVDLRVEQ